MGSSQSSSEWPPPGTPSALPERRKVREPSAAGLHHANAQLVNYTTSRSRNKLVSNVERQLPPTVSLLASAAEAMRAWFASGCPGASADIPHRGSVHVLVRGQEGGQYCVDFQSRRAYFGTPPNGIGSLSAPLSSLECASSSVYEGLMSGKGSPMNAFLSGQIKFKGERNMLRSFFMHLRSARQWLASHEPGASDVTQATNSAADPHSAEKLLAAVSESIEAVGTVIESSCQSGNVALDMAVEQAYLQLHYLELALHVTLALGVVGLSLALLYFTGSPAACLPCLMYAAFVAAGGNASRRAQLLLMAAIVLLGLRSVRATAAALSKSDSDRLWTRELRRYARFVFMRTAHFKGLWVKLAQYLSTRADIVPPEFVSELRRVQDAMPATPFEQVRKLVVDELQLRKLPAIPGVASPGSATDEELLGAIFEEFDEAPIASASIAQVHRAVVRASVIPAGLGLPQGSLGATPGEVVVKVQHPGVDVLMRHDIGTLGAIVAAVAWLEPDYDFRPVLDEWAREAAKEVDFSRESRICRHVGKTLFREGLGDVVRVPAMVDLYNRLHDKLGTAVPSPAAAGVPTPEQVRAAAAQRSASDVSSRFAEIAAAGQSPTVTSGYSDGSDAAAQLYASTAVYRAAALRLWDEHIDAYSYFDADGKMVHRPYWLWGPTPEAALEVAVQSEAMHAPKRILVQEFIKGAGLTAWAKANVPTYVDGGAAGGEHGGMKAALAPLLDLQEQLRAQLQPQAGSDNAPPGGSLPSPGSPDAPQVAPPASAKQDTSALPLKVDATALMTSIVRAFAVQMHAEGGVFHGDPHPGNIIIEEWVPADHTHDSKAERVRVPRAVLLDFGLSKQLSDSMRVSFARMLVSTATFDVSGLLDAFDDMGLVLNYEDPMRDLGTMAYMYRDVQPRKEARAQVMAQRKKFREQRKAQKAAQLKKPIESWPADLLFYLRATEMLHGVGSSLGVTVPYMQVMLDTAKAAVSQYRRHEGGHGLGGDESPQSGPYGAPPPLALPGGAEPEIDTAFLTRRPKGSTARVANSDIGWAGWSKKGGARVRDGAPSVQTHLALAPRLVPPIDGTSPPRGGMFNSRVEAAVFRLLREQHRNGDVVGIQVCVARAGAGADAPPLVELAFGQLGEHDPRPMRGDTLVNCFSVTKGVTAAALHLLLQHLGAGEAGVAPVTPPLTRSQLISGLQQTLKQNKNTASVPSALTRVDGVVSALRGLGYTTAVAGAGWPAFAAAGKDKCSIAHVLAHQTGLHHALPADVSLTKIVHSEAMEEHLAETAPLFPPGTRTAYQYYTYGWLVQGIVRGLTGGAITVGDIVRDVIAPAAGAQGELFLGAPLPDGGGGETALDPTTRAIQTVSHIAHLERSGRLAALSGMLSPGGIMGGSTSEGGEQGGSTGSLLEQGGIDGAVAAMEQAAQDLLARHAAPEAGAGAATDAADAAAAESARVKAEEMLAMVALIRRIKGKEYMLEPRLFNKRSVRGGEIPSANGHFSARGLARFYAALPRIVQAERLQLAASPLVSEQSLTSLFVQGGEGGEGGGRPSAQGPATMFGLGFQVYGRSAASVLKHVQGGMPSAHGGPAGAMAARAHPIMTAGVALPSGRDADAMLPSFGHSGFGGSIALLDGRTGLAVGITVTKLSNGKEATRQVLRLLRAELGIVDMQAF